MSKARYVNLIECPAESGSEVYLAHDRYVDRDVELKIFRGATETFGGNGNLQLDGISDPRLAAFFHEAKVVGLLEHPAVPPVLDMGRWEDDAYYYTMKLARGESLRTVLARQPSRAHRLGYLAAFGAACRAVAYGHERGVVHRNLTPEAIVIGPYGEVFVDDWERASIRNAARIATRGGADADARLNSYHAPEIREGREGDARSDVYSLGAILYFLLLGTDPPEGVEGLSNAELNDSLGAVCRRAMAPDPEQRYADVMDLFDALPAQGAAGNALDHAALADRHRRRTAVQRGKRRRTALIAGGLVALIAATVYTLLPERSDWAVDDAGPDLSRIEMLQRIDAGIVAAVEGARPRDMQFAELTYWADIVDAATGIEESNFRPASTRLADTAPELRGWEWGYLQHALNTDRMTITTDAGQLSQLAITPDGTAVIAVGTDFIVREWSISDGALLRTYKGHLADLRTVAISPDGKTFVSAGWDKTAVVWDRTTGNAVSKFTEHKDSIWTSTYLPDGSAIATGGDDGVVRIWDPVSGQETMRLADHGMRIWALAASRDGRKIVSGDREGHIMISSLVAGGQILDVDTSDRYLVTSIEVHPSRQVFAASFFDGSVVSFDLNTGRELFTFDGHTDAVWHLDYSPDGKWLATASRDGTTRLWDANNGDLAATIVGHDTEVNDVAFTPDGTQFVTTGDDGRLKVWRLEDWIPAEDEGPSAPLHPTFRITTLPNEDGFGAIALSPDASQVATGAKASGVRLWDVATGEAIEKLSWQRRRVSALAYSDDGAMLAVGWFQGSIDVWDLNTKALIHHFTEQDGGVLSLDFSTTDNYLAIGDREGSISVWNLETNARLYSIDGHSSRVHGVAFHPYERRLASAGADRAVRIWDEETQAGAAWDLQGHTYHVKAVEYSPGGRYLLSASADHSVMLWDTETGEAARQILTHTAPVNDARFTADGRRIVTAGEDDRVRLWDVNTGRQVLALDTQGHSPTQTGFSVDGRTLVAVSLDGAVLQWQAYPASEDRYPGDSSIDLADRIERYKRQRAADLLRTDE